MYESQTSNSSVTTSRRNIIQTRPETKKFTLAQEDMALDIFKELWDHENFEFILEYTKAEAIRQGNHEFYINKPELHAFFGL